MIELGTKTLTEFEIKDADRGEVTAVVSVFNVVDRDGDVILPGAIKDGASVKLSSYGHDVVTEGKPPVGRGVIRVDETRAVLHAKYFMSTERGRDAFNTVKELGADSEWSIGWPNSTMKFAKMTDEWRDLGAKRLIAGLDVLETSPVFLGANQFTRTVATKAADEEPTPEAIAAQAAEEAERVRVAAEERKAAIIAAVEETLAKREAEERTAAELKQREEETLAAKAAADAEAMRVSAEKAQRAATISQADKIFERFQRNMRQYGA